MKTRFLITFLLAFCSLAHAQTYYVPAGVTNIRAMIVGGTPLQGGTAQYWRDYCAAQRVGLAQSLADLPAVAAASGHPEIANAPIVTIGTSAGANAATATAIANPTRAVAVVGLHGAMFALGNDGFNANRSGENGDVPTLDFSAAYGIPMIHNFDNNDGFVNPVVLQSLVEWGRAHGAPWTFFIHNDGTHTDNDTALNTMILPWLTSVLDLRVPTSGAAADGTVTLMPIVEANGWLGDIKTKAIASYATYAGDKAKADWFPSQSVATIWNGYHYPPSYTIPAQPVVAPSGIIADLTILDPANNDTASGTGWKICANLKQVDQMGSLVKGYLLAAPPASVAGQDFIRPIVPGKTYIAYTADPIFTFRVTADATVYVAHSDNAASRPAWLSTWTNTGEFLSITAGNLDAGTRYTLFKKDFIANAIVSCGTNAPAPSGQMYLTIVKPLGAQALPSVSVSASTPNAVENGATGAFTVSRTGAMTDALTVNFAVSGTASSARYSPLGTSVVIPAGQSSATVTVTTINDSIQQNTETVVLTLAAHAAYNLGTPTSATVNLLDDDSPPLPVVTVADTITTASEPSTPGQFTVSRTGATTSALTVNFTVSGSATSGTDYTSLGTSVVIPAGQGGVVLAVAPIDDTLVEGTETVTLSIASSAAYALGTITVASVNIADNDTSSLPVVTIAATTPEAAEGGANGVLTVTRTGATTSLLAVTFGFTGTATRAVDFTVTGGSGTTLNIPAGQASATMTVVVTNDTVVESTETAICTIGTNANYTVGSPSAGTVNIADNDGVGLPTVTITATNANASEPSTTGTFTVTRTGATSAALTVNFATPGTATSGTDYTALAASVSIPIGQASTTITVTPIDDTTAESSETVIATLSTNAAYTLGSPSSATVNIADNDSGGSGSTVTVTATVADAAEHNTSGRFTFTRTTPTTSALTVNFTVSGTAASGVDFTSLGTSVTIAANQTTAILNVPVIDDGIIESTETVILTIAPSAGYIVGAPASATVNLADNDADVNWVMTGNGVTYATHGSTTMKLDIYQPKTLPGTPMPVLIWIAGGGWSSMTRSNITNLIRDYVLDGFTVVSIDHTNSGTGKWPIQIQDCKAAVRWLRANAATWQLDAARIAVSGSSSGAHMAAMLGTTGGTRYATVGGTTLDFAGSDAMNLEYSDAVQAVIPIMPPTHLLWMDHYFTSSIPDHNLINSPESQLFGFAIQTIPELASTANPLMHISASTPPFFITQGTLDTFVPFNQSELLNEALVRAGRSSTFWTTVGGGHDGSTRDNTENILLIQQWLKRTLLGNTSNALPIASFTASVMSGPAPLSVNFNGSASSDPDGTITKYAWSFGDDTGANNATASYTYTKPGTYPVTLCVRDSIGASASVTQTITVLASTPASGTPPVAAVDTPTEGLTLTRPANTLVAATVTDSDGTVVTVEFILDGVSMGFDTVPPYNFTWGNLAAGTHTVSVRGYDSSGNTTLTPTPVTFFVEGGTLPTLSITATDAAEPSTAGSFIVTRTGAVTDALAVNYAVTGTATGGTDFTALGSVANIPAGQASTTITVTPIDDATQEGSETVIATLSTNAAYTLGSPSAATVNIADNDTPLPTVTIAATNAAEPSTTGAFTVTRTGATTSALAVSFAVSGTATSGTDFTAIGTSVNIPIGQASASITVTPIDDSLVEGTETVIATLSSNAAYTLGSPSSATVSIADNDSGSALPSVIITATNAFGSEPSATGTFTVMRLGSTTGALTVNYALGGTATNGTDYTTLTGSVSIASGQTSAAITVTTRDDTLVEGTETVVCTLTSNAAYTIGSPASATVNIADNDTSSGLPIVTIASSDSTAAESSGTANTGNITVTRGGATTSALTVPLTYSGTAVNGVDYTTLPASVTIAAAASSASLLLTPIDDALVEGGETAAIGIGTSAAYTRGTPASVGIQINDNDNAAPIITTGIVFATHGAASIRLNVYLPATGSGPWPVIIFYPGGGWSIQSESFIDASFTDWTASGYAVISANYVSSNTEKWPAQIRDAKAAVRWVRANAATYGFDPTRIGVTGGSSGAHIAAYVALSSGVKTARVGSEVMDLVGTVGGNLEYSDAVQAAAPMFPPTDLLVMDHYPTPGVADHNASNSPESGLIGAAIQTVPEKTATANPIIHVRPGVPPMCIFHGTNDALVDFNQGELLNAALFAAAQPVTFWPVQGGGHGPGVSDSQEVIGLMKTFFDRVLLGATANALPVPTFTASALSCAAPLTVDFDASASTDADGVITKYTWANGDDTGMGSAATASYTYTHPGVYPVTLAVRDDQGGTASITQNIIVYPATESGPNAPSVTLTAPAEGFLVARPGNLMATVSAVATSGTVASVEFWLNDQPYAWDSKSPYAATLAGLAPGRYRLVTRVSDTTGNSTTSSAVNFRVLAPTDVEMQPSITSGMLSVTYYRFTDGTVTYAHERSTDLTGWTPFTPTELPLQTFPSIELRKATDPLPIGSDPRRFLRMQITTP